MNAFEWLLFVVFAGEAACYLAYAGGAERPQYGPGGYALVAVISTLLALGMLINGGVL